MGLTALLHSAKHAGGIKNNALGPRWLGFRMQMPSGEAFPLAEQSQQSLASRGPSQSSITKNLQFSKWFQGFTTESCNSVNEIRMIKKWVIPNWMALLWVPRSTLGKRCFMDKSIPAVVINQFFPCVCLSVYLICLSCLLAPWPFKLLYPRAISNRASD